MQQQQYPETLSFTLSGSQEWINPNDGFYDIHLNPPLQGQMNQFQNVNILGNQNLSFANKSLVSSSSMALSDPLAAQIHKQAMETDQYIQFQNERLRLGLHELRKHQMAELVRGMESMTMSLLRQKNEDIARANERIMELEERLRKEQIEKQAWKRQAQENEAMIMVLNNTLENLKENVCFLPYGDAEDEESCFDIPQEHLIGEKIEEMKELTCKACNSKNSCVLFLPCRHLCSCKSCGASVDACPVCNSPKNATMEVLMS